MTVTILTIVALLVAAAVLIFLELLTPVFGVLALLALGALVWAVWEAFAVSGLAGSIVLMVSVLGAPAYTIWLFRVLPRWRRLGKHLYLPDADPSIAAALPEAASLEALVGRPGVAESLLRPSGNVRVAGRRFVGVSESGFLEAGTAITVIGVRGSEVVVRAVKPG
jgi:membrane-bound ClpP family serine protease